MAKGMLSEVEGTSQRQTKVRKVLQPLQVSPDEQKIYKKNMVYPDNEILPCKEKLSKSNEKLKSLDKENVTSVRRSKRRNVASGAVNYVESPEVAKAAKSSAKNISKSKKTVKSKKSSATVKKTEQTKLNQSKLNFSTVATNATLKKKLEKIKSDEPEKCMLNTSTEITEDSGFDPNCGASDQSPMNSTAILPSLDAKKSVIPYDKVSILIDDTPPLSYWRDLAEQRRVALEKALHENELLHDQLTVLEAENSQLKQLVKEAENLAAVLKGVIE